ncbi:HD domain-containing protein [Lysinibacillus sphaericus]|uniref:Metal-dependent phosphohydrolase n=2 Tax=Lysinibacillus TaxID=400634 RepID=A0A2S0K6M8_LYSSH|nr:MULTISPECIES: HD domain-containing phosphohydrolase [Lysinibacillus]AVK99021.1 metal-dependent phosphohydrolase [Lysinibacillus sphaericus]MED4544502.1 HD domain-containing protein [Lysinibacillus sphaericus]TKI18109.1 HD domain-containing protein [Lysinibacillus sphaericus]TKI50108.1 HD domain-containing protein [Lysinibacillus tabacifolii]UDK97657.1 HD domain-containing protein [Lysinibacillus sphaericus]
MLKKVILCIDEVEAGDILAEDIFSEYRLLAKKDLVLTERIIALLKLRRVEELSVYLSSDSVRIVHDLSIQRTMEYEDIFAPLLEKNEEIDEYQVAVSNLFMSTLENVVHELRYGQILKSTQDTAYVRGIFERILAEKSRYDLLMRLKEWDEYSFVHSFDVFVLGTIFARQLGLTDIEMLARGYLFHDIGKVFIPQEILSVKRKLSEDEFDIVKTHTTKGYELLIENGEADIAYLARDHHERFAGKGYPNQLCADDMSEGVQLLQIIDVYSAMTSKRVYHSGYGATDALAVLYRDRHLYNEKFMNKFVECLGIYPVNSVVLLSDNRSAQVELVYDMFPTLPKVKLLDEQTSMNLPLNYSVKIVKMIDYRANSFEEIFNLFIEQLIRNDENSLRVHFNKLIDHLHPKEIVLKIFLPAFRILRLLTREIQTDMKKYKNSILILNKLLEEQLNVLYMDYQHEQTTILVVETAVRENFFIKLVQSILYIDKIVPFFINPGDDQRITQLMEHCGVNVAYFIEEELTIDRRVRPMREGTFLYYSLSDIEELLVNLVGMSMKKFLFEEKMQERLFISLKA